MTETEKIDLPGSPETSPEPLKIIEVKQSNTLVSARYDMTAAELNIFIMLLHEMKQAGYKSHYYRIDIAQLQKYCAQELKYTHIKKAAEKLLQRVARIVEKTRSLSFNFISSVEIPHHKSFIELGVDDKSLPYYKELDTFTIFQLNTALNIRGKYGKRFYMLLSKYRKGGYWVIGVDELKSMLELKSTGGKELYSTWQGFKTKVIEPAQRELMESGDLYFTWKVQTKKGKEITHLYFDIKSRNELAGALPVNEKIYTRMIKDFKLSDWQAREILAKVDEKAINNMLYQVNIKATGHKIQNLGGYTAKVFGQAFNLSIWNGNGDDKPSLFPDK